MLVGQNVCAVLMFCVMRRLLVVLVMGRNKKKNVSEEITASFRSDYAWRCSLHMSFVQGNAVDPHSVGRVHYHSRLLPGLGGWGWVGNIDPVKLSINA